MAKISRFKLFIRALAAAAICACALACWTTLDDFGEKTDTKSMASLEEAVRRAAVSCYAAEGSYPDRLDYLVERYGLQLNDRYAVHYDVFASNLAPDVTVVEIPSEEEIWGLKK